ncbi:immunity 21 family protein [Streptomyces sp. NWU339]|uniref:immunity 21 family protein n=1 Tax=Streptomyces sp. NWU339 TaxID=2185284 RepID=UPI00215B4706|nr:immunity 21 family protein [Streptomyces sp. NWU339]
MGGAQALVLGDEPTTSCCLPERRAFLRRLAADGETGLRAAAEIVLAEGPVPDVVQKIFDLPVPSDPRCCWCSP